MNHNKKIISLFFLVIFISSISLYSMEKKSNPHTVASLKDLCFDVLIPISPKETKGLLHDTGAIGDVIVAFPEELIIEYADKIVERVSVESLVSIIKILPKNSYPAFGLKIFCQKDDKKYKMQILHRLLKKSKDDSQEKSILECLAYCSYNEKYNFLSPTKNNLFVQGLLHPYIRGVSFRCTPFFDFLIKSGVKSQKVVKKLLMIKDRFGLKMAQDEEYFALHFAQDTLTEGNFGFSENKFHGDKNILATLSAEYSITNALFGALSYALDYGCCVPKEGHFDQWLCGEGICDEDFDEKPKITLEEFFSKQLYFLETQGGLNMRYALLMKTKWNTAEDNDKNERYLESIVNFYNDSENINLSYTALDIEDKRYRKNVRLFNYMTRINRSFCLGVISLLLPFLTQAFKEWLNKSFEKSIDELEAHLRDMSAYHIDYENNEEFRIMQENTVKDFWLKYWPILLKAFSK